MTKQERKIMIEMAKRIKKLERRVAILENPPAPFPGRCPIYIDDRPLIPPFTVHTYPDGPNVIQELK